MAEEDYRDLQFGCIPVCTNGVWRATYERLYPHPPFQKEYSDSFEARIKKMLGGKPAAFTEPVSPLEMQTRMARTRMVDQAGEEIPVYEESQEFFADFMNAYQTMQELICLESTEDGYVTNKTNSWIGYLPSHGKVLSPKGFEYDLVAEFEIYSGEIHNGPTTIAFFPREGCKDTQKIRAFVENHDWNGFLVEPDILIFGEREKVDYNFKDAEQRVHARYKIEEYANHRWRDQIKIYGDLSTHEEMLNFFLAKFDALLSEKQQILNTSE